MHMLFSASSYRCGYNQLHREKELRYSVRLHMNVCMCTGAHMHVGGCKHI